MRAVWIIPGSLLQICRQEYQTQKEYKKVKILPSIWKSIYTTNPSFSYRYGQKNHFCGIMTKKSEFLRVLRSYDYGKKTDLS